jgi:hypothetical protein
LDCQIMFLYNQRSIVSFVPLWLQNTFRMNYVRLTLLRTTLKEEIWIFYEERKSEGII